MEKIKFRERIDGLMLDCVEREQRYSMAAKHMHSEYEIYVLLEGEQYYFIEDKTWHVAKGMIILIGKEKIHWTSMAEQSGQERILVEIKEEWINPFLEKNGFWKLEQIFETYQLIHPDYTEFKRACQLLIEIKDEIASKKIGFEIVAKMKLAEFFLLILRSGKEEKESNKLEVKYPAKYRIIQDAVSYIQIHCHRKLLLQEIADALFVSRCYLTRIFKEVTGVTVNEYIAILRIQKGKKLLKEDNLTITKISEIAGFESITYFEKVFKQYTGKTPRNYRQQLRNIKKERFNESEELENGIYGNFKTLYDAVNIE